MIRRKKIILSILSIFLILLLTFIFCIAKENSNTSAYSIVSDGLERNYRIHIPPIYNESEATPLVFVLHGGGGTGKGLERYSKFSELSDRENFIVIYPDGIEKHWNDGRRNVKYRTHTENIDDIDFISILKEHITEEYNIDERRIYIVGISNGAMMSHRLACELSDKISAIASLIGSMPEAILENCSPSEPISVLMMNGTEDPLVPYEGGEVTVGRRKIGKVLSVEKTIEYWVNHNDCSTTPEITWLEDKDTEDGTKTYYKKYTNGNKGTEVILYVIEGGGHTWSGGSQYLPERIIGKTSRDFDATEVIWEFFKNHTKE